MNRTVLLRLPAQCSRFRVEIKPVEIEKMVRCPHCAELFDPALSLTMPFCSERCRQLDLARWLDEGLGIPVEPGTGEDDFSAESN